MSNLGINRELKRKIGLMSYCRDRDNSSKTGETNSEFPSHFLAIPLLDEVKVVILREAKGGNGYE